MTITLARLSDGFLIGFGIDYTFDTTKNTSEGGISGRKSGRDSVVRNYMGALQQGAPSREFQKILLSARGQRYPFEVKDWADNYQVTNEVLDPDLYVTVTSTTHVKLYRTYTPTIGSLSYAQRILCPDSSVTFKLNGNVLPHLGVTVSVTAPGIAVISTVLDPMTDVLSWSGPYYIPVCLMDQPSSDIVEGSDSTSSVLFEFKSIRLEEILEAELTPYVT